MSRSASLPKLGTGPTCAPGAPLRGLYAAGNDMASVMGGNYPGGGITLGPAMVFGYVAASHIAATMGATSASEAPQTVPA